MPIAVSSAVVTDCATAVGAVFPGFAGLATVSVELVIALQLPARSTTRVDTVYEPAPSAGITPVNEAPGVSAVPLPGPGSEPIHHSPPATPDRESLEVALIVLVWSGVRDAG